MSLNKDYIIDIGGEKYFIGQNTKANLKALDTLNSELRQFDNPILDFRSLKQFMEDYATPNLDMFKILELCARYFPYYRDEKKAIIVQSEQDKQKLLDIITNRIEKLSKLTNHGTIVDLVTQHTLVHLSDLKKQITNAQVLKTASNNDSKEQLLV